MTTIAAVSETSLPREPKPADGVKKKLKPIVQSEPKSAYRLQFTDAQLISTDLGEQELEDFKRKYPQIARLLSQPELLTSSTTISTKAKQESWQSAAQQLLSAMWKVKDAAIFCQPVDWRKLEIPDYPEIVKKPMDFSTIKVILSEKADFECLFQFERVFGRHGSGLYELSFVQWN